MGMEVHYKHVSTWLLERFAEQPELVEPFTTLSLSQCREPNIAGLETVLNDTLKEIDEEMHEIIKGISPKNGAKILGEAKLDGFSLGKYFENVQFHISGEITDHGTSLLSQAVTGIRNIGPDIWPYGSATFVPSDDVEEVATLLSKISEKMFLTKYQTDQWDKLTSKYALFYFQGFASYYAKAAKAGHAMLIWGA